MGIPPAIKNILAGTIGAAEFLSLGLAGAVLGAAAGCGLWRLVVGPLDGRAVLISALAAAAAALPSAWYGWRLLETRRGARAPSDPRIARLNLPDTPEGVLRLMSEMPAPFILLDREMRHIAVTERHLRQHGLPPREEFLWRHHYEIFPGLPESWKEMHRRTLAGETFSRTRDWWIRPDGRAEWLAWEIKPWHDARGEIGGMAIYGEVITAAVEAEDKARAAAEHLRRFYELIPHALWTADPAGALLDVSPNLLEQTGMTLAAMKTDWETNRELVHPDDRAAVAAAWKRSVATGEPCDVEQRFRLADGSYRWFRTRAHAFRGSRGETIRWFGMFEDIHDKKLTELDLRHAEERLRQVQKMEALGQLTGGVAHDFNNLLAVLGGNLELLEENLADRPDLRALAEKGIRAVERGATLTRSLLAFSRQQPLSPRAIDLGKLVQDMADLVRRTMPENIEIEVVAGAGLWNCEADPGELQNALLNLVANARDAMPGGGRLTIETGNARLDEAYSTGHGDVAPGQYAMLAVTDTGHGMPPEVAARAFDPFFTTKGFGAGSGLGLSMVYGFVKQSRGHVRIYS